VAIPPGGTAQGAQERPQLSTLVFGTQLPAHAWKPALHATPHTLSLQDAMPLAGDGHAVHAVPQLAGSLSDWQVPWQSCIPAGQTPRQLCAPGMQAPAQSFVPLGQVAPHETPSHVATPPVGDAHGVQDTPQVCTSWSDTQNPLQPCIPAGQSTKQKAACGTQAPKHSFVPAGQNPPHETPSQVAPPPVSAGQGKQLSPQWATSMRDTQTPPQI